MGVYCYRRPTKYLFWRKTMHLQIGTQIKKLRLARGMTQEAVAEYVGVSYQAVSKWETGVTLPDIALLPALATLFGVRIDDAKPLYYAREK